MGKSGDRLAAAKLRKKAEAALKLERDGRHEEAIETIDDLVASHEGSALVLHLAGFVHGAAARRAGRVGDKEATKHHIFTAHDHLAEAKRLVPNCVAISDLLAKVLYLGLKPDEAEIEARAAVNIASPVDPADNGVMYDRSNSSATTRDQRVDNCRRSAQETLRASERRILGLVRDVLELDAGGPDGAREALKKAKEHAKRYPSSSRVQLLSAQMQLQRLRLLDPAMDIRAILDRIRADMKASSFGGSLLLAMFHAKLCFVLGSYENVHFECVRAYGMSEPVDPKLEDVPPGSVQGDSFDNRVLSVGEELGRLLNKLFLVADDFRCSMTTEKQDGFLSVRLVELQEYYDQNYENYQWAAQTISDALSFFNRNRSWRFWICPYCAGNVLLNPDSLLEHMSSKHLLKLRSAFDSVLSQYLIQDDHLDEITVYQDSEGRHFFRFNKSGSVFARLSLPTEEMSIAGIQEEVCQRGKQILEEIKLKLKRLPADKLSAEFDDKARPEIQDLWHAFVRISFLDYRILMKTFARPFIWTKLLQSLSENKAASKISNADIDVVFPNVVDVGEVHAEDNVGRFEIRPNSRCLKWRNRPEETSISIYRKSIEVLGKDTDVFVFNFIIQILWNWRGFRDEFLRRRPVCTLPRHEGACISQMLYDIFSCWQKDDHLGTYFLLISIRDTICEVSNDTTAFQNVKVNTSSYIITTILNALLMPEVFLEVNSPVDKQPANPAKVLCNKEIISGFGIKESTTCGDKLDAESLQISEVKSIADDKCRQVDPLFVSTPEFSTLGKYVLQEEYIAVLDSPVTSQFFVLHSCTVERENQHTLREVMKTMDPDDFVVFPSQYISPDTVICTFVSMIFYHEGKLLSIARDYQNKWLVFVYNDAVATEFNSWEDLLHGYGDHEIQHGDHEIQHFVCFFENIKIIK